MGELITRATIWMAMGLWCGAMLLPPRLVSLDRWIRGVGLIVYLAHILFAYRFFYDWSHQVAWEETAKDTEATVGIASGFGLLVNFAFAGILLVDQVIQFRTGRRKGGRWIDGLILFLVLNGAVVFGEGSVRVYGVVLLGIVFVVLGARRLRHDPGARTG